MKPGDNTILLFKTNIRTESDEYHLKSLLDKERTIEKWCIDTEDIDCVLKIVSDAMTTEQVITFVRQLGYDCAELD